MAAEAVIVFDPARADAIEATAELLGDFYAVPVRMLERMDLACNVGKTERFG